MRNVFVENHIKNVVEKLSLDPFLKTEIEHNPGSVVFKFYEIYSYYTLIRELSKYIESKLQTTCFYLI